MLVLPQLVDLAFQDINLTLESCCVCHLATLIAHIDVYLQFLTTDAFVPDASVFVNFCEIKLLIELLDELPNFVVDNIRFGLIFCKMFCGEYLIGDISQCCIFVVFQETACSLSLR